MPSMRNIALVFAGGFCGTLARALLAAPITSLTLMLFPHASARFPWDIFAINLSGALALGLLYGLCERGMQIPHDIRLAAGHGFLGAFTTFSSYIVGGEMLARTGQPALAAFYVIASLAMGVGCAWAGYNAAGTLIQRRVVKLGTLHIDVVPSLEEEMEDEVLD
ncbi:MAG TPA: CrcB family protein [Ktedonobacterales bacterium]|nr:CrcB family protein [Ktedonobacterales bacterium]